MINNTEIFNAYEYLPTPLIIFSNESVIYANEKAIQLLQLPKKPNKNQLNVFKYILPEYQKEILSRNNKILKGKSVPRFGIKIKTYKGKVIDIETKSRKISVNKKAYILTIFYDVTEQNQTTSDLASAKNILDLLGKNNTDIIFKYDYLPNEQYSYFSDSVEKILGYKKELFYKDKSFFTKQVLPEDLKKIPLTKDQFLKWIKKENRTLLRYRSKNNKIVWLETLFSTVKNKRGEVTGIIGISRDVTKEKETENLLKETKTNFELIGNNAHDIIYFYTYHPKPKYLFISNSVEKILGYKTAQFYKDPFFISKHTIGKTNNFKDYEARATKDQLVGKMSQHQIKYQVKNAKGGVVWMEDHINPVYDDKGKISFLFGIIRNINELKEKEKELDQKWSDYKLLLDQSPISFFIHSNGICLMCNKSAVELLKVRSEKEIIGTFIINYIIPEQRARAMERMRASVQGKEHEFLAYQITDSKNNPINVEIKTVPIRYNGIDCVLSLVKDVSEREQFEKGKIRAELIEEHNKELTNQKNKLSSIFENSSHLVWTIDDNYNFTYFNNNFKAIFKRNYGVEPELGKTAYEIIPKNKRDENRNTWHPLYRRVFNGERIIFERKDPLDNQPDVYREVYINPIYSANGIISEIACMASDISEIKRNQRKLIEQSAKLSSIFEMSSHYIWTVDKNNNLTSFNKNYTALIKKIYETAPIIGKPLDRGKMLIDDEYIKRLESNYKRALEGEKINFELELGSRSNEKVYLDVFLNPVFQRDKIVEVSGIAHDITAAKLNEERTIQSLKEKEVLLKEVHHRVKNNMQIISSILNLQSSYTNDVNILNLLRESQNRIKTMAYIHESLYQNKTFSSINFNDYLTQLINNIVHSYSVSPDKIHLVVNCEKTILNLDTSIPLGLIINELVTNSIKHAFPASSKGKITINLRTQNKFVFLTVEDNGVGISPDITPENSGTLGLQLVYTLIDQINGKIEFENLQPQGTKVNITFLI